MPIPAYILAGTYQCKACGKLSYASYWQARLRVLWTRDEKEVYLGEYRCPKDHDRWHVYNIKRWINRGFASGSPDILAVAAVRKLKRTPKPGDETLDALSSSAAGSSAAEEALGAGVHLPSLPRKDLHLERKELNRKLAVGLRRLPKKEYARLYGPERRLRAPGRFWIFVYHHRGKCPTPRVDSPRSEALMAKGKMLGYWNGFVHKHRQGHCSRCSSGKPAAKMRRRNRMRWKNITRQEINQELSLLIYPITD